MDPYGSNGFKQEGRKVVDPFADDRHDNNDEMMRGSSNAWSQSTWRASAPLMDELPESTDRDMPEGLTRSVAVMPSAQENHFDWGAAADPFAGGFPGLNQKTQKGLGKELGLPPLSMSLPTPSFSSTSLGAVPSHFSRSTSFYSNSSHEALFKGLVDYFEVSDKCDHICEDNKIVGIAQGGSGESCSFVVSVFHCNPDNRLLVEFRRTFGCCFAFRQFYDTAAASKSIAQHITNFVTNAPAPAPLMDLNCLGDLPPLGDLGDLSGFDDLPGAAGGLPGLPGLGFDPLAHALSLLQSKYVMEQREGAAAVLNITKGKMSAATADRLIAELCSRNLLQSMDSDVARHACEVLENLCCADQPGQDADADVIRRKVWQSLLDHMMNVLDSPDSLSTRKCKRHVARALQAVTATSPCEIPSQSRAQYVSILREYRSHSQLSDSINATLHQIGVN